jgi:hypothetical protein
MRIHGTDALRRLRGPALALLGALAVLTAGACTTASGVTGKNAIAQARYAIFDADTQGAGEFAPEDLQAARDRLEAANKAIGEGNPLLAARLANEATATSRLAIARTSLARAEIQAAEAGRVKQEAQELRATTKKAREEQR